MPSLIVGVDEVTIVLQAVEKVSCMVWPTIADRMIEAFLEKSRLSELFGKMENTNNVQSGYTHGVTFADRPWYLVISWNEDMPNMGVCVRFSAYAYAVYKQEYRQKFQADMNIAILLRMVQDDIYTPRLSRIDLTADYIDYSDELNSNVPFHPDAIYTRLKDGSYMVKNWKDRQSVITMSGLDKDGAYETFYIGSRRGKTNGYLRVYDKKREQIETMGFRYDEALRCVSWVRFEAVFSHEYAHQISWELLDNISTRQELQQMIAKCISDRYRFFHTETEEITAFTDDLMGIAAGSKAVTLGMTSPRDNDLRKSINHLREGSGLYPTLFKACSLWGDDAETQLIEYLYDDYIYTFKEKLLGGTERSKMREIQFWLTRHKEETKKLPLESYLDRSKHHSP